MIHLFQIEYNDFIRRFMKTCPSSDPALILLPGVSLHIYDVMSEIYKGLRWLLGEVLSLRYEDHSHSLEEGPDH